MIPCSNSLRMRFLPFQHWPNIFWQSGFNNYNACHFPLGIFRDGCPYSISIFAGYDLCPLFTVKCSLNRLCRIFQGFCSLPNCPVARSRFFTWHNCPWGKFHSPLPFHLINSLSDIKWFGKRLPELGSGNLSMYFNKPLATKNRSAAGIDVSTTNITTIFVLNL